MEKPAWYVLQSKRRWAPYFNLLHWPFSLWHLSYVVIGAALAPEMNWGTLGWTLLAFALAMGIGAHALDLIQGDPLRTGIPRAQLILLAITSIAGAVAIGAIVGVRETVWVIPCIIFGGFIVFAYNLEIFRGFFHTNFWFGFAWGAFPVVTAYIAQTYSASWGIIVVAGACLLYSLAQRVLSTQARFFRRKVGVVEGHYFASGDFPVVPYVDGMGTPHRGQSHNLTKQDIIEPAEVALKFMTWTVVIAAIGLLLSNI